MKAYSVDLRSFSKSSFQKLVKQQKIEGNLHPKPRGKPRFSHLNNASKELREIVANPMQPW